MTRSGRLVALERRTDARGDAFVRFTLGAQGFLAHCVAFEPRLIAALARAGLGDPVWVKGRLERQAAARETTQAAEAIAGRSWRTLIVRALTLPGEPRAPAVARLPAPAG